MTTVEPEVALAATRRARTFRLFVSSTFDDFELERNFLYMSVWPRLKRFCEQRDARFEAVDLRWGVSSQASFDQQTMNICLDEIERCRRTIVEGELMTWQRERVPAECGERLDDAALGPSRN